MKTALGDLIKVDDGSQRRRESLEPVDDFVIRVTTTDANGAITHRDIRLKCSLEHACATADRMQAEIKADGEPGRVYVVDACNVPIAAGGECLKNRKASKAQRAYLRGPNWPRRATER